MCNKHIYFSNLNAFTNIYTLGKNFLHPAGLKPELEITVFFLFTFGKNIVL